MKIRKKTWVLCIFALMGYFSPSTSYAQTDKLRIVVVSSYHREYIWSQETNEGFCDAMIKFGYFNNQQQAKEYTKNDYIESSRAIVKKLWMDSKRKKSKVDLIEATSWVSQIVRDFKPDLIFLGDDNAANYIGNVFLDSDIPIVFWGVNVTPVKYGLVDSIEKPGHNVTGVYQKGYYEDSLKFLKALVPNAQTIAILGDASTSSRIHTKAVDHLIREKKIPFKLLEIINTDNFELFKKKALELQNKVDVFFMSQYSTLKDKKGNHVSKWDVAKWYLQNIKIPEAANQDHFVIEGMLCAANDSGYNQGFEAVTVANEILTKGLNPANYPFRTPPRGNLMVNKERAKMLGIMLTKEMGIEEFVEEAEALKR